MKAELRVILTSPSGVPHFELTIKSESDIESMALDYWNNKYMENKGEASLVIGRFIVVNSNEKTIDPS